MVSDIKSKYDLIKAFPLDLEIDARHVLSLLTDDNRLHFLYPEALTLSGETLTIPYRIYYKELSPLQISSLTLKQQMILATLYTRHHDGYIREKYVRQIISHAGEYPWITPYLVLLLGEYVREIIQVIYDNRSCLNANFIKTFVRENPETYRLIQCRVPSYWDCHHRWKYPAKKSYVGFQVLNYIKQLLNDLVG